VAWFVLPISTIDHSRYQCFVGGDASVPDQTVVSWLNRQPSESIWTTSVTVFEIEMGIALLATGNRRRQLERAFARILAEDFESRVLSFDQTSASAAATLAADRQQRGRPIDFRDTQIAGIALARRAAIATRNLRHFSDLSVDVIDPWE
jgi:predicted nucleic acid-binding protein